VLDRCVLWLEVASYVWPDVCSEWLQVVSGLVLCGGVMCICGSVIGGLFRIELYCTYRDVLAGVSGSREEGRLQCAGNVIRLIWSYGGVGTVNG